MSLVAGERGKNQKESKEEAKPEITEDSKKWLHGFNEGKREPLSHLEGFRWSNRDSKDLLLAWSRDSSCPPQGTSKRVSSPPVDGRSHRTTRADMGW